VKGDYSRVYLTAVSQGTLTNLYRQRGHWRAAFRGPISTVVESPGCNGVSVTFAVMEGLPYKFQRAEWTDTTALPAATLDKMFGIKSGDIADVTKLDAGLRQIHKAYGTQGYVAQSARYTPRLDDATGMATFEVAVEEGPQFMMGELEITGLPDADVADLRKRWRLKAGEMYDASYADQFHSDVILPWQRRSGPSPKKLSIQARVDPGRRVVDVRLVSQ
jgi:outer membrane protein assembly factor BamA